MGKLKPSKAELELIRLYRRNGILRYPNEERFGEGMGYKKGHEIRWMAYSEQEAEAIAGLLQKAGFKHGKIYAKRTQFVLPVYGYDAMVRFVKLLDENPEE
jgi:hypothetical protein